jgi:hypothetical protein
MEDLDAGQPTSPYAGIFALLWTFDREPYAR